ncbi:MAG TPA: DNA polymerase domain-containing protein [Verrucomicrobiae bacterium]|nr:DNA polymerase domain-containing protein [Verrucomicrobiae bacterium]
MGVADPIIIATGYLFDIYHIKDKIILWIKELDGKVKRLEHPWSPSIYVVSDSKSELISLLNNNNINSFIKEYEFVNSLKYSLDTSKVLKISLKDSSLILNLAKNIENLCKKFEHYRLYNIDIPSEQSFLYEKDIYPLGLYNVLEASESNLFNLQLIDDSINSFDYDIPNFKFLSFDIAAERKSIAYTFSDKINAIQVNVFDNLGKTNETFLISKENELDTILEFSCIIKKIDPDIILTTGGDQFLFPHLFYKAKSWNIDDILLSNLNRESDQDFIKRKNSFILKTNFSSPNNRSSSFLSYGKVYFRSRSFYLYGRIHIDSNNSFIHKDNGLDGLAEISRVCRIPLQLASRSTIGKCLSSLYFYNAQQNDILIPWKPTTSEIFKTFNDLLIVDKGGFVFESKPGAHDNVAEFDFASLYPNIMFKKNVSYETINCECCKYEKDNKVPGLEHLYYTCKKNRGIVPLSLKTVLDRRAEYKKRKNDIANTGNTMLENRYDNRQAALKWILVTSFGYLGFSNSKFGRIDAHIVVCAFARDILLKTSRIAENHGFEILHGIVDSIWIKNNINKFKDKTIFEKIKKDIEEQTGFSISFEGIYKWIVFDSSKKNQFELPALNRYFGVFENKIIKARGIELRRHDTPPLFIKFQNELLKAMSDHNGVTQIKQNLHNLKNTYKKYKDLILSRKVHYSELIFTKRITKNSDEYSKRKTIESDIIHILLNNGKWLHAGEEIRYVITDFYNKNYLQRALPLELCDEYFEYDVKKYCQLLDDSYDTITRHFYKY